VWRTNLLLCLACLTGIAQSELPKTKAIEAAPVPIPMLSLRAGKMNANLPAIAPLPDVKPLDAEVGTWQTLPSATRSIGVENLTIFAALNFSTDTLKPSQLPVFVQLAAESPSVSSGSVLVPELNIETLATSIAVQPVNPMRHSRTTQAGWDLTPFRIARHSAMGDLRMASNQAETRGDFVEAERLRGEFWRLAGVMDARREAFAARPEPTRGGLRNEPEN
jgi:hypothetical protein